jgi:hypothetical protein
MGHLRRINGTDRVSDSHLIAAYCCPAPPTQGAKTCHNKALPH